MIGLILSVFFTNMPYSIYTTGNIKNNKAASVIGFGLIDTQIIFWIANLFMSAAIYYKSVFCGVLCSSLYITTIYKTKYLLKINILSKEEEEKKEEDKEKEKKKEKLLTTFAENIKNVIDDYDSKEGINICSDSYVEIDEIPVDIFIIKTKISYNYYKYNCKIIIKNSLIFLNNDAEVDDEEEENKDEEIEGVLLFERTGYTDIRTLLEDIEVFKTFKFIDHKLLYPEDMEYIIMQRSFFPIPVDKNCSVCYEPTNEYTVCKHPICFRCRYACIKSKNDTCPICRKGKLKRFPDELMN